MERRSRRFAFARMPAVLALGALVALPAPVGAGAVAPTGTVAARTTPATLADAGTDPGTGAGPAVAPEGPLEPSAQYEDWLTHRDDRIDFAPGGRVTVPFRPRAGDGWLVDGGHPRALPAGRLSGNQMRRGESGATAAPDQPVGGSVDTDVSMSGDSPPADGAAAVSVTGLHRAVLGFLPYWEVSDASTTLDYATLSTIAYFSVGCAKGGNLQKKNADGSTTTGWAGWTSSKMTSIINAAHNAGTRVALTLSCFGWSSGGATRQKSILTTAAYRDNLAQQVAKAVRDRGADGVNLDFEPLVSGTEDGFVAFIKSLRKALDAYAPGYELTFDTMGYIGNYPIERATATGAADALMIMGYDYRSKGGSTAGSISPLTGPLYDLNDTIAAYTRRVPPSKIILGLPYYGRAWSTATDDPNAKTLSQSKYGSSVNVTYASAVKFAADYGRRWDPIEQAPWTAYQKQTCTATYGCVTSWRELYYDDAQSLGLRYDMINREGLRGAGIWALGYDGTRSELHQVLADKFLRDTTPPVVGITSLATTQVDEGFVVTWTAYDDTAVASYDVQVSQDGGGWSTWLSGVTGTSDVYLGADGHAYAFRVRATDTLGNTSSWYSTDASSLDAPVGLGDGVFGRVTVDGLHMRAKPDTSANTMTTLAKGTIVYVIDGPRNGDGYTWYRVNGPFGQWGPVDFAQLGGWVAVTDGTKSYVVPRSAPYGTTVAAGIRDYAVGGGGDRVLTPGSGDDHARILLSWTNAVAMDGLTLRVFSSDGSLVGTRSVNRLDAGDQTFWWDGTLGNGPVQTGNYVVQLVGTRGTKTYTAPSADPVTDGQLQTFGIAVAAMPPSEVFSFAPSTPNPTRHRTIVYSLVFGGPVSGLGLRDFSRSGTATGCVIGSPAGSGATYSITLTKCSAGTVRLTLRADAVRDAVGNRGPETATSAPRVIIDRTAPITSAPRVGLQAGLTYGGGSLAAILTWTASDAGGAGLASYDVERSVDGGRFKVVATGLTGRSLPVALAGGHTYRFAVRAHDAADNVGPWRAGSTTSAQVRQDSSPSAAYTAGWHVATASGYAGGSAHYATAAGARVTYSFTGRSIAVVTTTGPARGQVKVYLDGKYIATLDLESASMTYRQVVWARRWASAGSHTLKLVVVGTADRPRVDVDAFLVLR